MTKEIQKVTKIVKVERDELYVTHGGHLLQGMAYYTERVFGKRSVPRSDYKVTYSIDPNGKLGTRGACDCLVFMKSDPNGFSRVVCFLPPSMIGKSLTRTVKILEKREKGAKPLSRRKNAKSSK